MIEQLVNAHVGGIGPIEEVDHHDIVFLSVPMAAANALLDALGVPRHVVVHHEITELEVDTLGRGFGGNHDACLVAEILYDGGAFVGSRRAGGAVSLGIAKEPLAVDFAAFRVIVGTVEEDYLAGKVR